MSLLLSKNDVDRYRADGYIIPSYKLQPEYLKELQNALNALIRNNPGIRPEKLVNAHLKGSKEGDTKGSEKFLELAMHKPILDLVEQVMGPNIILWGCHVFCKPASEQKAIIRSSSFVSNSLNLLSSDVLSYCSVKCISFVLVGKVPSQKNNSTS